MPMTASSEAAVVTRRPWSWAAGMKRVPMSPLADHPHTKNDPASSQKARVREASRSRNSAMPPAPRPPSCRAGGST